MTKDIKLVEHEHCSGCAACQYVCPKQCIAMKDDGIGQLFPEIDREACIQCGSCMRVCPSLNPPQFSKVKKVYAGWNTDDDKKFMAASGGIATAMYEHASEHGEYISGAVIEDDFSVDFKVGNTPQDIERFRNSKYVYSSVSTAFGDIKALLKDGKKVTIIALPCQIAAIRKLYRNQENLTLIDLVCHGSTPTTYLQQHISQLENKLRQKAAAMFFRDPYTYTYTFTFTLYDAQGKRIYAKRTKDGDLYNFGYHRAISYRENCYHCLYARPERVSDITLKDSASLGVLAPWNHGKLKISNLLINTQKGQELVNQLISEGKLYLDERPVKEPFIGDKRLSSPTPKNKYRLLFEKRILECNGDFIKAIAPVLKVYNRDMKLKSLVGMPRRFARKLKKFIIK